jgi:hypothetical protein
MDFNEENNPQMPQPTEHRSLAWIWNLLTVIFLLGSLVVGWVILQIYQDPASALNPYPVPTMIPTLFIPTLRMPATLTPTTAPTATLPQATLTPTLTYTPTSTVIAATPSGPLDQTTPTNTPRGNSIYSFGLEAEPRAVDSKLFNSGRDCDWMGVAGRVFDMKHDPVALGIIVQVGGVVDGKVLNVTTLTGTARQYGDSGYEVTLADKPVAAKGAVWIRLLDQSGFAISDRVFIDTSSDCTKNLVFVNFKQIK